MRIEDVYFAENIRDAKNRETDKSTVRPKKYTFRDRILEMISSISNRMRD